MQMTISDFQWLEPLAAKDLAVIEAKRALRSPSGQRQPAGRAGRTVPQHDRANQIGGSVDGVSKTEADHARLAMRAAKRVARARRKSQKEKMGRAVCHHLLCLLNTGDEVPHRVKRPVVEVLAGSY